MNAGTASLVSRLKSANQLSIRTRLVSAFAGVASLTLLASIVAFFSYNYIGKNLNHIETHGIPVMSRALTFARQTAEYSMIVTALRAADDKATLLKTVGRLKAKYSEMSATLEGLSELRSSSESFMASTDEVAAAIDRRLSASAQRKAVVEHAIAAHRAIVEKLAPLLDDARFDLAIGLELLEQGTTADAAEGILRAKANTSALEQLSDIRAESHIVLGILMEVSLSPSIDLLPPLRDRMIAAIARARKPLVEVEGLKEGRALGTAVEALLALGFGPNDLFRARRAELEAIRDSWRLVSASQARATNLARQVQDSVRSAEQATSTEIGAVQAAITQSQAVLIGLVIVSLGSAIIFAWIYVGRGLLVRLGRLNDAILALAGGNLEVDIPSDGRDELTRIAAAVEVFKRNAIEARDLEADKERARLADLRRREASFRLLFEGNPVPMWVFDRESSAVLVRQRCGGQALRL